LKPYYEHAGITIYHGDCRDVLPHISGVDLVLVDPPYGIAYQTHHRPGNDWLRRPLPGDESLDFLCESWPWAIGALRPDRHWYCFASPRRIGEVQSIVGGKHIIAWDKGDRGTVGDLEAGFGEAWEAIFYGMKGRRTLNGPRPRTVIRYDWSGTMDPGAHPTVKPVGLLRKLILMSSDQDEMVLDFAMGSGTTLEAAKILGRRAIGIEIEERYCEIAAKRLSQEVMAFT
jgi:DNA modification methylase